MQGGQVGPELTAIANCIKPHEIVEGVLWPSRQIKDEYRAYSVVTSSGKVLQGYKVKETPAELLFREASTAKEIKIKRDEIEEIKEVGVLVTVIPCGLEQAFWALVFQLLFPSSSVL